MTEPQLLRRIDRNTVVGDKERMLEIAMSDKTKTHFLYRVGGIAFGIVKGESQFGEWIKLIGRFRAENHEGEQYVAAVAFLPGDATTIIADKLAKDGVEQVTFLYDVFLRYDKNLATNYGFIVEPVRKEDEADPLDTLFKGARALPAPKKQPAIAGPKKGA